MPSTDAMLMTLAGRSARSRRAQRLRQRLGQEEQRLDVEVHDLVPAAFGEFVELRAPCRACIVDEDVELRLQLDDFASELVAAFDRRNVDRQRDAFAVIGGGEFLRGRLAGPGLARGDVDLRRALREKSGRDHLADAARAARHQRDAAVKREQILEHAFLHCFAAGFGRGRAASQGSSSSSSLPECARAQGPIRRGRRDGHAGRRLL